MMETAELLSTVMADMPSEWRRQWCGSNECACRGCANVAGRLVSKGFTKEQWEEWCKENPDA